MKFLKKVLCAMAVFTLMIASLTACAYIPGSKDNEKDSNQTGGNTEETGDDEISLVGIPQNWIELFTFDNVTIFLKNTLTIKRGDEYRCVDGKWYAKYQGSEVFENHSGRYIFDLYLTNYSIFSFDEENSCYKATDAALDDSGYLCDISITVVEGKITNIVNISKLNSSTIVSTLDFYNYGTTQME